MWENGKFYQRGGKCWHLPVNSGIYHPVGKCCHFPVNSSIYQQDGSCGINIVSRKPNILSPFGTAVGYLNEDCIGGDIAVTISIIVSLAYITLVVHTG